MKKQLLTALAVAPLVILVVTMVSGFRKPVHQPVESQIIYGPAINTESLHNAEIGWHGPEYDQFAGAWFKKYILTVSAPADWHFTGTPFINCVRDDQGAFAWNNFPGSPGRCYQLTRTPNSITYVCWVGSRSIAVQLACEATRN